MRKLIVSEFVTLDGVMEAPGGEEGHPHIGRGLRGGVAGDSGTVDAYLSELPDDRRAAIAAVRAVILEHLPPGFEEGMQYGMIGWSLPLSVFPNTYNGQPLTIIGLAAQKNYLSLYLMGVYGDEDSRFREQWQATGKKLDMGKSCVRFRRLDDVPLEVVGEAIARTSVEELIAAHERAHAR